MKKQEQVNEELDKAMAFLMGKYDTVQMFVTTYDVKNGVTNDASAGFGNWYARKGVVLKWISRDDENDRENVRKRN